MVEAVYDGAGESGTGGEGADEVLHVQSLQIEKGAGAERIYAGKIEAADSGRFELGVRVRPHHEVMLHPFETGLCTWATAK